MNSDQARLLAAEHNYFEAWRLLAGHAPNGELHETADVLFASVPVPVAYFNSAFVKPPADERDCIDQARAYFSARNLPYTLRFREDDEPEKATAVCEASGLVSAGVSPLMVAPVADIETRTDADVRVVDGRNWTAYVTTMATGFGIPVDVLSHLFAESLTDSGSFVGFLAYEGGVPVSTSALIVSDDVAGVYNVATPEPFRRRGLGEATTRAAVAEGERRGCVLTTLQASDIGYPIYERMGYRTVARWPSFTG